MPAFAAARCAFAWLHLGLHCSPSRGTLALREVHAALRCAALQAHHAVSDVASDFYAGVQAALITRSGSPAWVPPSLKDVRRGGGEPPCCRRSASDGDKARC